MEKKSYVYITKRIGKPVAVATKISRTDLYYIFELASMYRQPSMKFHQIFKSDRRNRLEKDCIKKIWIFHSCRRSHQTRPLKPRQPRSHGAEPLLLRQPRPHQAPVSTTVRKGASIVGTVPRTIDKTMITDHACAWLGRICGKNSITILTIECRAGPGGFHCLEVLALV